MICETNALCFTDTVSSAGATFNYWVRVEWHLLKHILGYPVELIIAA